MKLLKLVTAAIMISILESCIQKEPLNAECDIIAAEMPGDILNRAPRIDNDKVIFTVKNGVSVTDLAPEFTLTPGASINPPSGTARDFIIPQNYTVTSEDGKWEKVYTVEVQSGNIFNLEYDFEHVREHNGYDIFYEINEKATRLLLGQAETQASNLQEWGTRLMNIQHFKLTTEEAANARHW